MRHITFYRGTLLLPILVPLLIWALAQWGMVGDADAELAVFFMYSLPIAGLPYLFFAGGLAWWMRDKAPVAIRRMMLRAPVLFIPCAWVGTLVQSAVARDSFDTGGVGWFLILTVAVLLVGYTYVGFVEAARWFGERFGVIADPRVAT